MEEQHTAGEVSNGHREDRVRVVYLDESIIIDVLNWISEPAGQCLVLPQNCGLPDGTRVLRVWVSSERRSIGALVWHPDFDPVCPGGEPLVHCGGSSMTSECLVLHRRDYPRM